MSLASDTRRSGTREALRGLTIAMGVSTEPTNFLRRIHRPMRIILCIPGTWSGRAALLSSLVGAGLVAAGPLLVELGTDVQAAFEWEPRDERMSEAFRVAGARALPEDELAAIEQHRSVLYLIVEGVGQSSLETAVRLGGKLLEAGGLGIKTETAGVAAPAALWRHLANDPEDRSGLQRAFTVIAIGREDAYTCGLHNFGRADAQVKGLEAEHARHLLDHFLTDQVVQGLDLQDGDVFRGGSELGRWKIELSECTRFEPSDPFYNPFGVWTLKPLH